MSPNAPRSIRPGNVMRGGGSRYFDEAGSASPFSATANEPQDDEQDHRADRRTDDGRDDAETEVNAEPRQQPVADEGADDAETQIGDQAVASAAHQMARKPAGDKTDDNNDQKTFTRHRVRSPLLTATPPTPTYPIATLPPPPA